MAMRFECNAEGFEGNWIEVAERWTRREVEAVISTSVDADYIDMLRSKTTAVRVELATGEAIETPEALTYDALMDADELILGWLGYVLPTAIAQRRLLGNASLRLSSNSSGTVATRPKLRTATPTT